MRKKTNSIKKQIYSKIDKDKLVGLIIIVIITLVGVKLLTSSHAQSPYVSTQASTGVITSPAFSQPDSTASRGYSVEFGQQTSTSAKLLSVQDATYNVPNLVDLHANAARGEIFLNGTSFNNYIANDPGMSTSTWIDNMTTAHITPQPLFNSYQAINGTNVYIDPTLWANAVVSWCKEYCTGGTFYVNNPSANSAYAPHILENLNEPSGNWYRGGVVPPIGYANMLIATRSALNNAGLSNIAILGYAGGYDYDMTTWTSAVAAAGGYAAVQGLATHPYSAGDINLPVQSPLLQNGWNIVYYLHQTYNMDIYVTELGFCTTSPPATTGCQLSGGFHPEANKDADIKDAIDQLNTVSWLKEFNYYDLQQNSTTGIYLIDPTGVKTPAYTAFKSEATADGF